MTRKGESVTTDIYPRASFGAITNWGDKKCGEKRLHLDDRHGWRLVPSKRSHTSAGSASSSCSVSHCSDWALHMGKCSWGCPWDKGQAAVAAPIPTRVSHQRFRAPRWDSLPCAGRRHISSCCMGKIEVMGNQSTCWWYSQSVLPMSSEDLSLWTTKR